MDRSSLGPCATRASVRRSYSSSAGAGSRDIGTERATPVVGVQRTSPSRMETVWRQFHDRSFSSKVVDLLVAGNRPGTLATYDSAWRKWTHWCVWRDTDPLSTDLTEILQFLTDLLASGKSYSLINIHRSMLSRTLGSIEGVQIGANPLVVRLIKGGYHKNPPVPSIMRCGTRVK